MNTFSCPECQSKLVKTENLQSGDLVQCPRCATQFNVPEDNDNESLAFNRHSTGYTTTPTSRRPEVEDEHEEPRPSRRARKFRGDDTESDNAQEEDFEYSRNDPDDHSESGYKRRARSRPVDSLDGNYRADYGEWWNFAAMHYSPFLGASIGFQIVLGFINGSAGSVPLLGPLISLFVVIPLTYGPYIPALRQLRRKRWEFGDFFSVFNWYLPVLGYAILISLINLGCMVFMVGGAILAYNLSSAVGRPQWDVIAVCMGISSIPTILLMIFFNIRLGTFALFLIVDQNYSVVDAMRGSWRLTQGKLGQLFGMHLLLGLLTLGGLLACCVGVLFTVPQVTLMWATAYMRAMGEEIRPPRNR